MLPKKVRKGPYTVDIEGRVFNTEKQYYIAQTWVNSYLTVSLRHKGKNYRKIVHKMVAQMFLANPHKHEYIIHKDGNHYNNHIKNLKWVNHEDWKHHTDKVEYMVNPANLKEYWERREKTSELIPKLTRTKRDPQSSGIMYDKVKALDPEKHIKRRQRRYSKR